MVVPELHGLRSLCQPLGGLLRFGSQHLAYGDEPRLTTQIVRLGDLGRICPNVKRDSSANVPAPITASGAGLTTDDCLIASLGEGLERYCACLYTADQVIWASANELGRDALDLDTVPRCSARELAHPRCPLVLPDKGAVRRWVRGLSLLDGRLVYLPLVMVYLFSGYSTPSERIAFQISTGCAAHESFDRALIGAIFEIFERDSVSLTWLQRLRLTRIEVDDPPPVLAPLWEHYQASSKELEYFFFDATTDIGVPTVYGLQVSRTDSLLTTLVSCSTAMNPVEALVKVFRDMAASRTAFRRERTTPDNFDDFSNIFHGAAFMARAEQRTAFDFLLDSDHTRFLSDIAPLECTNEKQSLQIVLELLRRKRFDVYAVDLTSDEALRSGIRVVRVLIPALQPFSFHYLAQYKGHSRLYDAPRQMGYPVYKEEQLNHWPQPFA
jgi:ribosomal protein S12 methylthiotransferase accessory factor